MSLTIFKSFVGKQFPIVTGCNSGISGCMQILGFRYYSDNLDKKAKVALKQAQKRAKKEAAKAAEPPAAEYIKTRIVAFADLKKKFDEEIEAKPRKPLKVNLPDGKVVEGETWHTTPFLVAKGISVGLASDALVGRVNNVLWDYERPLEFDCELELLKIDEPETQAIFWKTAALVLGETLEKLYGETDKGLLGKTSATNEGFYADIHLPDCKITADKLPTIETRLQKIFHQRAKVDRIQVSKKDALELFAYNKFKQDEISKSPHDTVDIYRCGGIIEISQIPLLRHTKKIKNIRVVHTEPSPIDEKASRVYGVAFQTEKELMKYEKKRKGDGSDSDSD